jgi:hypothetical protein
MVVKVREMLAVGKRAVTKMDVERLNLKKLHEGEVKEQYQVAIKNKFAGLETESIMGTSIGHATLLEETSKFGLRRVLSHIES